MDIKDSNGNIVKEADLTDSEADISKALKDFYSVLEKYGVTSYGAIVVNSKKYLSFHTLTPNNEKFNDDVEFLLSVINDYVTKISGGYVKMIKVENPEN